MLAQQVQVGLDLLQHLPAGMVSLQRDVAHEAEDGDAVMPRIVGCQVAGTDGRREAFGVMGGPGQRQARKGIEPAQQHVAQDRQAAQLDAQREDGLVKGGSIEDDQASYVIGVARGITHADRAAPIVKDESDILQCQRVDQLLQVGNVLGQAVVIVLRLVREAAADVVGHDDAILLAERRDQVAVIEGPGGIAVQHHDRRRLGWPFVEVMVAYPVEIKPMRFEWIERPVSFRRSPVRPLVHHCKPRTMLLMPLPTPIMATRCPSCKNPSSRAMAMQSGHETDAMLPRSISVG